LESYYENAHKYLDTITTLQKKKWNIS